ncbi:MAG TPA: hypothetical protein VJ483_10500 [Holophagaceae bacterium]|nr:hypothetical protein [Holophagaceae bacterium]
MRAMVLSFLLLALPACTPSRPLPPPRVRTMVETEVRSWHRDHHHDCPEFVTTKVDYLGDVRAGHTEIWTVDACGKTYRYQVLLDADIGYNITVSSLD